VCTCVRACVRACPSLLLSLSFALAFSLRLSVCLSLSLLHTHSPTRSHTLSLIHSLTNAHTHQIFIPIFLAHSHTFLSLSFSFSLSISLLYTYTHTLIHKHIRTHTLSHVFTRSSTHSLLSRVRAALSSVRVRTRALFSLFLSPFLPFLFFAFAILSLFLSLHHHHHPSRLITSFAVILSLVRFISFSTPGSRDFSLKESYSHRECILSLSCPWRFLSDGKVREKNRGRDKFMKRIGISMYPRSPGTLLTTRIFWI